MKLRWFLSATLRQATDVCKHVRKLLHAQKDIMTPMALDAVTNVLLETETAIADDASDLVLIGHVKHLDEVAGKMIKPYPHGQWRENIEVMLVAIVVAMGIRTFFVQPFKIPTGSMQPTLYGWIPRDLRQYPAEVVPGMFGRVFEAVAHGRFYHEFTPTEDGEIKEILPVSHLTRFINYQMIMVQYKNAKELSRVYFPFCPDDGLPVNRPFNAGLSEGLKFKKGQTIMRMMEDTGDHLFVDRFTYNFRHPHRGDIVVFKTKGIVGLDQTQFYIKRLVGLPNERVSIGEDRHIRINGTRLDASTPHFENVYGFDPSVDPQPDHYSGHVFASPNFAALSPDGHSYYAQDSLLTGPQAEILTSTNGFLVCGDNTMNSLDSRYWGEVPADNFIGKAWVVYWPFTTGPTGRFGWGQR